MDKLTFYAPIEKTNDEQRMVYGYASTEALDSQGEVVKKEALALAIDDYMKWANIREMHQPSAVGKTKKAQIDKKGLYIAAKIVDEGAWAKVKEGVYNGFSIGGRASVMKNNEITAMTLSEISLVDRPANPECKIDVYKMDDSKPEETKPVEVITPVVEVPTEVKPEEKPTEKTIDQQVIEAKEKVSKPDLIKIDDVVKKDEFEKIGSEELKKCMHYVGELAFHLNELHHMEERYEMEEKYEGESSKEYAMLVDALKGLGETLKALATKAVAEMNEEEKEEVVEDAVMAMSDEKKDIEKAGKEISSKNAKIITEALARLQEAVKVLAALNTGGQLTPDEEKKLREGLVAGSEVTSGGHVGDKPLTPPDSDPLTNAKADVKNDIEKLEVAKATEVAKIEDTKLAKVEAELSALKEQFGKLQNLPQPIKAKASYVTVEKFEGSTNGTDLQKAEKRMDEIHELLKYPHDANVEKEAKDLSLKVMKLRREAKGLSY